MGRNDARLRAARDRYRDSPIHAQHSNRGPQVALFRGGLA
jgi:hypothetical protein